LLNDLLLDVGKGQVLPELGVLVDVEVVEDGLHAGEYLADFVDVEVEPVLLASEVDLRVGVELVVVEVDGLLVLLQQVQDLVELEQQVEQALELGLPLLAHVHLQHLLLLELDRLEDHQLLLRAHEDAVEPQQQDGQDGQHLDLDEADFAAVEVVVHPLLQPADDALLLPRALLQFLPALEVDDHHADLAHLILVDFLVEFLEPVLASLQLVLLQALDDFALHHQDRPGRVLELVVAADVELRLRQLVQNGTQLLLVRQEGLPLLLQAAGSDLRIDLLPQMGHALALPPKDYIAHLTDETNNITQTMRRLLDYFKQS
jgi:hypothetical protein